MSEEQVIKLNVGGTIFLTSSTSLSMDPDSMLAAMISQRHFVSKVDDAIFIDRDPAYFRVVLNFLRTSKLFLDKGICKKAILEEAQFFNLHSLEELVWKVIERGDDQDEDTNFHSISSSPPRPLSSSSSSASPSVAVIEGLSVPLARPEEVKEMTKRWRDQHSVLNRRVKSGGPEMTRKQIIHLIASAGLKSRLRLQGVRLSGVDLSRLDLGNVNMAMSDLSFCNLAFTTFIGTALSKCNFSGSYMQFCNCNGSNLVGADFSGADLRNARFCLADMMASDFKDAKIDLTTKLNGAILRNCLNMTPEMKEIARQVGAVLA